MTEAKRFFRSNVAAAASRVPDRGLARTLVLLALFLSAGAALAQQMQVINLHYRRADDLIPVLQPLLEPGDAITGLDDKLFVRADPATMARIFEALGVIDQPPRQLVITVGQDSAVDASTTGVRGAATMSSGNASTGVNRPPGTDDSVQVVAVDHSRQSVMRNVSSVRALDGSEAYIAVGRQVPVTSTRVTPGWGGPAVTQSTTFRDVSTGFYAITRVNGDMVTLSISPRQQSYDRNRGGAIHTAGADSTVSARLGEWVELGAVRESGSGADSGLLVWGRRTAQSQYTAWIKVDEAP
jgi:Bacterial type II/III secretion system short domain